MAASRANGDMDGKDDAESDGEGNSPEEPHFGPAPRGSSQGTPLPSTTRGGDAPMTTKGGVPGESSVRQEQPCSVAMAKEYGVSVEDSAVVMALMQMVKGKKDSPASKSRSDSFGLPASPKLQWPSEDNSAKAKSEATMRQFTTNAQGARPISSHDVNGVAEHWAADQQCPAFSMLGPGSSSEDHQPASPIIPQRPDSPQRIGSVRFSSLCFALRDDNFCQDKRPPPLITDASIVPLTLTVAPVGNCHVPPMDTLVELGRVVNLRDMVTQMGFTWPSDDVLVKVLGAETHNEFIVISSVRHFVAMVCSVEGWLVDICVGGGVEWSSLVANKSIRSVGQCITSSNLPKTALPILAARGE